MAGRQLDADNRGSWMAVKQLSAEEKLGAVKQLEGEEKLDAVKQLDGSRAAGWQ